MELSRRSFLQCSLVSGAVLLAGCSASSGQKQPRGYDAAPRPLPIPPLLEGTMAGDTRVFQLTAQDGHYEVLPGNHKTRTWGFNGPFLGPTLRARRGEKVRVEVTNNLIEMTTVHWHGMKLPAYSDGGPHSPIDPGQTWKPELTINQPAATLWYHPHPHMATAYHAYRGLAGMFILEDEVAAGLEIPHDYGVDDLPVIVTDAKFTRDGQFDHKSDATLGLMGTTPLVNGITNASFAATTRRVRLRLLNAAAMRYYNFALSDASPLTLIATDSGLLDRPVSVESVFLGPGERAEVIIELTPGQTVKLRSVARADNFGMPVAGKDADFGFQDEFDILQLQGPADDSLPLTSLPAVLDPAAKQRIVPNGPGVLRREFVLNTFTINGQMMDMERVDVTVSHDAPEIWTVTNENADWPHNFHIHNARFQVVDFQLGAGMPPVELRNIGWKDTVNLPPKATARLLVEFGHYPDPTIPYMFHCHMLLHEDEGMMGQYVIVDRGQVPDIRVLPAALSYEKAGSGHHSHAAAPQVIDATRSPYAQSQA